MGAVVVRRRLVGHCVVEIVSRAFYALHDTKTPVSVGVLAMSLNIGFSLLFSTFFIQAGWMPHGGLALANSLATGLEMAALLVIMRRRLNGLQGTTYWMLPGRPYRLRIYGRGAFLLACLEYFSARWLVTLIGLVLGVAIYSLI
jgi:putative peptidoglycan lipid II flippase